MNELFATEPNRICGEFANKSTARKINKVIKNKNLTIETLSRKHGSIAYTLRMKDERIIELNQEIKDRDELIKIQAKEIRKLKRNGLHL